MTQVYLCIRHQLDSSVGLGYDHFKEVKPDGRGRVIDMTGGHPAMDYAAHEGTYKQFLLLSKVMIVFLVLLLSGMAYFLV